MDVADQDFDHWRKGIGVIRHRRETQERVRTLVDALGRTDAWALF
jgi:hypothetical protein